ncbi:MAG: response regulator transcription factor [Alphaproteobacteria bacterium]|jgi:two-component system phosphate regulon response regulator OmpR|nr:response regulator transcription factor [Alphaproteobacteria bacterium]MCB1551435.1 response regulator transcription factor [Alphaproteobacteria bacterium]MCB9984440.1 response regulator transcription factor [Micavibrio sp.]HPQ50111.1 response regulator transcription factor [Alphaproteobacteria bacterium]HRK97795.1 response regulator transcription factor [Alphaproteobacteria bacterium]
MPENMLFSEADKPHILVVDDDDRIRSLLSRYLRENGFVVATAKDASDAEMVMKLAFFDALILDVMMPGKTGFELTQDIRTSSQIPILLLTALGEVDNRIEGLETGADDYLAKPFEPKELLLRLQSILRRKKSIDRSVEKISIGKWTYKINESVMECEQGEKIHLTSVESKLLEALARQSGKILSRDELAHLCGVDGNDRTVDVQITRLRKKIEEDSRYPRFIQTVRGQGYILKL